MRMFLAAMMALALVGFGVPCMGAELPDTYYVYTDWNPGLGAYVTGAGGYVDTHGLMGEPGAEYLFFVHGPSYEGERGAHVGYCYRVETDGDPNQHPDNPDDTGPVALRTFTFVSSHALTEYPEGQYFAGHTNDFQVDDTGIYYGASWGGIYHWDFDWTPLGWVVVDPRVVQTFARNPENGDWWITNSAREVFKWVDASWALQFVHPDLAGGHSDGMEIIGRSLFISDMTSDLIIQYRLDAAGNVLDPPETPYNSFTYTHGPPVEGMGYGPNQHIWIAGYGSGTIYELGGGEMQPWISNIPDQIIVEGETFDTFDLDDYAGGQPPITWSHAGNVDLTVNVGPGNVVTITYPPGWLGSETITFTIEDDTGWSEDMDAVFEVRPRNILINYQGKLNDNAEAPVDATLPMTFRIYDRVGASQWEETQSVLVQTGIFHVLLGTATVIPESLFDDPVRYLGVTVGGAELSPRQRITSVAYAVHALNSDKFGGFEADEFVKRSGDVMTGPLDVRSSFRAGTHSLVYDDITGYVGIGTETPDFELEVMGTAKYSGS